MSTIKVDGIRSNSATSDAITLASDGTCTANITNNLSNRNLIINGAMQVAQRGTSSTSSGYGTVDRFAVYHSTNNTVTQSQVDVSSSDLPYTEAGVTKALKVTNGNQSSAGAAEYVEISYKPEAQDIKNSGWNHTSSSSKLTFSCYVRSSVAQTFTAWFTNRDGTRKNYVFSFALAANTWTKITKTLPGNSGLTIDNDNGSAIELFMQMYYGTNYSQASPPGNNTGDWVNHDDETVQDMQTNWYLTNGATFEITGVQLEVDHTGTGVATDFEHRSFTDELLRCQRYYWRMPFDGESSLFLYGGAYGSGSGFVRYSLPVKMRATPTFTYTDVRTTSGLSLYNSQYEMSVQMAAENAYVKNPKLDAELQYDLQIISK